MTEPIKLCQEWYAIQAEVRALQARERELRDQIAREIFALPASVREGTHATEIGGVKLKLTMRQNYSLNKTELESALTAIERHGADGQLLAERLVKFKPELSVSEYKKAPDWARDLLSPALTIKPGMPTLEIA